MALASKITSRVAGSRVALGAGLLLAAGCRSDVDLAEVRGEVSLNGKPLTFGSVMLQPPSGEPARASIRPDGSFELETPKQGVGVRPGRSKVRVTCFEAQRPGTAHNVKGELTLGKSLIPLRYTQYSTSGLEVETFPRDNPPLVLRLTE